MQEVFFGQWDVRVLSKDAWFSQRIVITGSDAADGDYVANPGGGPGSVSGTRWTLHAEWNDNASSGWQPSAMRRTAAYTLADGLVVTIGIDDNTEAARDGDNNDVVIVATSLDPKHTPLHPVAAPFDFTVPEKVWWRYWKTSGRDPRDPYRGYPPPDDGKDPRDPRDPRDPWKPREPVDQDDTVEPRRPKPPRPRRGDLPY